MVVSVPNPLYRPPHGLRWVMMETWTHKNQTKRYHHPKKSKGASTLVRREKPSPATEKIDSQSDHNVSSNKLVKSTEIRASLSSMTYDDHQEYIQRMMQSISGTDAFSKSVGMSNRKSAWGGNDEWMDSWAPTSASDSTHEPGSQPRPKQLDDDDLDKSGMLKHGLKVESYRNPSSKDVVIDDEIKPQKQPSRPPFSSSRDDTDQYLGPMQQNDRQTRPDPHRSRPPSGSSRNLTKNIQSGRSITHESYKDVGSRDRRQSTAPSTSMKKAQSERNLMSLAEEADLDRSGDHTDWNGRHPSDSLTHIKRPTSERNLMSLSQDSAHDDIRDRNPRDYYHHRGSSSNMKRPHSERNLMTLAEEIDRDRDRARDYNHRYRRSESYNQTIASKSERNLMSLSQNSERDRGRDHNPRDYKHQRASSSPKKRPQSERNLMSLTEGGDRYRNRSRDYKRSMRERSESSISMSEHYDREGSRGNNLRDFEHRSASLSPMKKPSSSRILLPLNEESSGDLNRNASYLESRYEAKSMTQSSGRNRTRDTDLRDQRHRSSSSALERTSEILTKSSDERDRYNRREKDHRRRYSTSTSRDKGARSDRMSMPPERGERDHSRYREDNYDQSRAAFDFDTKRTTRDDRDRRYRSSSSRMDQNSTLVSARSDHRDYRYSRTAESMSLSSERRRSSKSPSSHRNRSGSRNSRHRRSSSHDERRREAHDDKDRRPERRLPHGASEWQEGSMSHFHDSSSVPTSRSSRSQRRSSSVDRRHRHSTSISSPRRTSSTFSRRSSMPVGFPVTHLEISSEAVDQRNRSEEHSESKSPGSIDSRGKRSSRQYSRHRSSSSNDSDTGRRSSKSPRTKSSDRKIGRDSMDWKALRDKALSSSASRDGISQSTPLQVASWHGTTKSRPRRAGRKSELMASSVVSFPDVNTLNEDERRRDESKKDKKERRKSSKSRERRGKAENPERRRSNSDGSASRGPSRRRQREMDKSAIVVQKWARRFIARNKRRRLRDEAAAVILEVVSPYEMFRRRLKNDAKYSAMASKAVLPIQQLIRSYQAKVELRRLKAEKVRACIHVQRIVRGHLAKLARDRVKLKRKQDLQQALARYEPERAKYTEYLMEKKKIQSELTRDISMCESKIQQVKDEYCRERKKLEGTKEVQKRIWGEAIKKRVELELAKKEAERVAREQEELANLNSVDPTQEIAELEVEIAEMKNWLQNTEPKLAAKIDERKELERANLEVENMFHELNDFAKAKVAENKDLSSQQLMLTKVLLPKAAKNGETATQEIHNEIRSKLQLRRTIYRIFEEVKSRNSHDQSLCMEVEVAIRQCERELSQDLLEGNKVLELLIGDMEALFEIEALRVQGLGECPHVPVSATGWDAIAKGVLSNMGKKNKFTLDDLGQD